MATKAASKRLGKEAQMMERDPPPFCYARPKEENVLEWHFILRGPPDTSFHGGEYWGQLLFPPEYPFKPPGIKVSTPSGRFHTDTKICTSMSDFHPGSWNPAWSVANILVGLLSFMCSDEMTTGSVMASNEDRCTLAKRSHAFNITQPRFKRIFPDFCSTEVKALPNMGQDGESSKSKSNDKTLQSSSKNDNSTGESIISRRNTNSTTEQAVSFARSISNSQINSSSTTTTTRIQSARQATGGGANAADQSRSRTIFPILVALAAYLFFSRLFSLMGSNGGVSSGDVASGL